MECNKWGDNRRSCVESALLSNLIYLTLNSEWGQKRPHASQPGTQQNSLLPTWKVYSTLVNISFSLTCGAPQYSITPIIGQGYCTMIIVNVTNMTDHFIYTLTMLVFKLRSSWDSCGDFNGMVATSRRMSAQQDGLWKRRRQLITSFGIAVLLKPTSSTPQNQSQGPF